MTDKARIVYMGTPEFAVGPLDALVHSRHEVLAVVTAPDRPAGRGKKLTPSAVKVYAEEHSLLLLQPEKLRDPGFVTQIEALRPDFIVVVAFRMLPGVIWKLPRYCTFNLHASLLPLYRGAAPIHRAVMNGEKESGVTTFVIDDKIDTGRILLREKTSIGENETTGELYERLMNTGGPLVVRTIDEWLAGNIQPQVQDMTGEYPLAPKLFREDQQIDWSRPAEDVHNHIRGLSPFPSAIARIADTETELKVFDSEWIDVESTNPVGRIEWKRNHIEVQCGTGKVLIRSLQWPGKRKMTVREIKNGLPQPYPSAFL